MIDPLLAQNDWLFDQLCQRDPHNNRSCPGILLSDIILYKYAQPFYWYYTSNDGELYRKEKEKITNATIFEDFKLSKGEKDIVGTFLSFETGKGPKSTQKPPIVTVEHFSQESFRIFVRYFMLEKDKPANGILMKFIDPRNRKNSVIQVTWSTQFCLLQRRTNIHQIDNPKIGFYEKIVTFEGPEHYSVLDSVTSPTLASDIQKICGNIAAHVKNINGGKIRISKMILHFKIDPFERLWLLYTTGLKIIDKTNDPRNKMEVLKEPILTIPKKRKMFLPERKYKDPNADKKLIQEELARDNGICINCGEFVPMGLLHDLSYYNVIANFKHKRLEEGIKGNVIPPIIAKLYPDLTYEKYKGLKSDLNWLQEKVRVCENCYLLLTTILLEAPLKLQARHTGKKIKVAAKKKEYPNANAILEKHYLAEKYVSKEVTGSYKALHRMFSEEKQHRNEDIKASVMFTAISRKESAMEVLPFPQSQRVSIIGSESPKRRNFLSNSQAMQKYTNIRQCSSPSNSQAPSDTRRLDSRRGSRSCKTSQFDSHNIRGSTFQNKSIPEEELSLPSPNQEEKEPSPIHKAEVHINFRPATHAKSIKPFYVQPAYIPNTMPETTKSNTRPITVKFEKKNRNVDSASTVKSSLLSAKNILDIYKPHKSNAALTDSNNPRLPEIKPFAVSRLKRGRGSYTAFATVTPKPAAILDIIGKIKEDIRIYPSHELL